jgi:ACS family tartrate transporter-like MFS transporter
MSSIGQKASRKIAWRLIPFLILCFFVAYLGRVNAGFAALTMNKELGLTAEAFGFGVGIFFFGYFIFEVPSNLVLEKTGARRWIARIMVSWGMISVAFAFVPAIARCCKARGFHSSTACEPFTSCASFSARRRPGFFPASSFI